MQKAFVALGANLGNAREALSEAVVRLNQIKDIEVTKCSSFYRTEPIDSSGPDYINAVVEVQTSLNAPELLQTLLDIEKEFGRQRPLGVHNAPRTMDLDLLLYGQEVYQTDFLTLPHPRMHERAFVLVPLCEISSHTFIPGKGWAESFLDKVKDQYIQKIE